MTTETEQGAVADVVREPPDGSTGTRIIRTLWLPVILTLGAALCLFAGALCADGFGAPRTRVVLLAPASGGVELAAGRADRRQADPRGWTVTVYGYHRVPCPEPCRVSASA